MKLRNVIKGVMGASVLAVGTGVMPVLAADITITMAAPDWPPTRFMKELSIRATHRQLGTPRHWTWISSPGRAFTSGLPPR